MLPGSSEAGPTPVLVGGAVGAALGTPVAPWRDWNGVGEASVSLGTAVAPWTDWNGVGEATAAMTCTLALPVAQPAAVGAFGRTPCATW